MSHLPLNRRQIISRRDIDAQLAALSPELPPEKRRPEILAVLKAALAAGRAEVKQRFEAGSGGRVASRDLTYLVDQLIRLLYDDTTTRVYRVANPTQSERLSIVAVGGYGRGELAPQSDVDLLFLLPYKQTPMGEQIVEHMLYILWDLGLKVGHATRSVDECLRMARSDVTIRTALLESRYLWGDESLFTELKTRFDAEVVAGTSRDFVEAKLAERDARHARMGDSRYVVEPNIKEGKGGLRDLHTLFWIAKYAYRVDSVEALTAKGVLSRAEANRFIKAEAFLWEVRFTLHYIADRAEERLTFDVQPEIARRLGYSDRTTSKGVERFMKHYFLVAKDIGDLTRIFCAALEAEQRRKPRFGGLSRFFSPRSREAHGFVVEGDRLSVGSPEAFLTDPVNILRLFWESDRTGFDIHPTALRLIHQNLKKIDADLRANPEANRLFLEILTSKNDPENTLRRLNEAGVLGRFVPDFGRVVAQMQFDMYHVYTVDEHTIFAIGILARIEQQLLTDELPLASSLMPKLLSRRALYVAVLLHDIAKGRGGDHSVLGEQVAYKLGPRFGLSEEETETVAWLVRWHLAMSNTAFRRDLQDPKTISDFVELVQSPERLKLLLVLTVVDIRAVGPKVWNAWKAGLLRELYHLAADKMAGGDVAEKTSGTERRLSAVQEQLRADLTDFTSAEVDQFLALGTRAYFLTTDPGAILRHARLVKRAMQDRAPLSIDTRVDTHRGITDVTIYTGDHPGLFAAIAGALALAGANIVDAHIFTLTNSMVLDSFSIQDTEGGAFERPDRLARLAVLIEQALSGSLRSLGDLANLKSGPARAAIFTVRPRVLIDNKASATHTVIEINGRDRPGLLHDLGRTITRQNLQIGGAKIMTYGEKVVDVFYVKDIFGLKIDRPDKIDDIRTALLAALQPTPVPTAAKPAARALKGAAE
ncbi:[protein-PII] uridylyltransferase [Lacibacterium aquatile]|uniref:Bifunctional uridylyltransferase/uridylyl-removing enzyme n=1 Tax=Lacibacterium aquatile TaxID=1168082 RepID=A0ABW5DL48_9PROT